MTKKDMSRELPSLTEVKVEGKKKGKVPSRGNREFVYVNPAFVGSVTSVNNVSTDNRPPAEPAAPITGVYREQYWACSRWPYTQRALAIAVGVLLGALIGLALSMILRDEDDNTVIGPIFTRHSVPD